MTENETNTTPLNDEQLDALLDTWHAPTMDAQLPGRIVAAAQQERRRQAFWLWRSTVAAGVAAAIVIAVLVIPAAPPSSTTPGTTTTNVRAHGPNPNVAPYDSATIKVDGLSEADFQRVFDACTDEERKALDQLKPAERLREFQRRLDTLNEK